MFVNILVLSAEDPPLVFILFQLKITLSLMGNENHFFVNITKILK